MSPLHKLPDLGLQLARPPADLGEEGHRPLEVLHRFGRVTSRLKQVRQVVLQRGLTMPVATRAWS